LEPDQTPLLAHAAYSQTIARRRLDLLGELARELCLSLPASWEQTRTALEQPSGVEGMPMARCTSLGRPVASLADAQRASADFVVVRTLSGSVRSLRTFFEWDALARRFQLEKLWQSAGLLVLRVPSGKHESVLAIWENTPQAGNPRLVFESDPSRGYRSRGGVELPVAGLRIWEVRDDAGRRHDLRGEDVHVAPRWEVTSPFP
jgi:hypothetical protein